MKKDKHDFSALEDDIESSFTENSKPEKVLRRKKILIAVITLLVILLLLSVGAIVSSVSLFLYFDGPKNLTYPEYADKSDIKHTLEFQIGGENIFIFWESREDMLNSWIRSMNKYNSIIHFERANATEDIYSKTHLNLKQCGTNGKEKYSLRERKYASIETRIDMKIDEVESEYCDRYPMWTSEEYYESSKQKCEIDAHPCFKKVSRGTSVSLGHSNGNFETCAELREIFPGIFNGEDTGDAKVSIKEKSNWWKCQWSGTVGKYTKYEVTFTFEYFEKWSDIAKDIMPPNYGEWSLRYTTPDDKKPEKDIENELQGLFYHLVQEYNQDDAEHIQCAEDYFNGLIPFPEF